MSRKTTIHTTDVAPIDAPSGQGTTNGDLVFTSGQTAIAPDGESLVDEPIDVQATQCLENVAAILREAGGSLADALKITVFLADIEDYAAMNEAYEGFFDVEPPARTAIEVADLPFGAGVEMQAIAAIDR